MDWEDSFLFELKCNWQELTRICNPTECIFATEHGRGIEIRTPIVSTTFKLFHSWKRCI